MKKILVLFVFLFSVTQVAFADFDDVSDDPSSSVYSPYSKAITWLQSEGIVQGYADGLFAPNNQISRAEFLKMIYVGLGVTAEGNGELKSPFKDIKNHWAFAYIEKAYQGGLVEGYSDGTFKPENPINRAEAFKLLKVTFFPDADDLSLTAFSPCDREDGYELDEILDQSAWYFQYLDFADELCVIPNPMLFKSNGEFGFAPDGKLTRGEMAEMIYRTKSVLAAETVVEESETDQEIESETEDDEPEYENSDPAGYEPTYDGGGAYIDPGPVPEI